MSKPIIGVCGTFASGKDTAAQILASEYNVYHVSTGDIVREKAMQLYGNVERETLRSTASGFRQQYGGDYFVREGYRRYQKVQDQFDGLVFSGVRSLGEGRAVLALGGELVFVDAPVELRYERMTGRERDNETAKSLAEFIESESKERASGATDEWSFNIDALGAMATYTISNDGSLEQFTNKVNDLAAKVGLTE